MFQKTLIGISTLVLFLIAVLTFNTLRIGSPPLPEYPEATNVPIDKKVVAERLAHAVRFPTISRGVDQPVAVKAFIGLHDFLADSFPKVHVDLNREVINDYSLLYTWEGSDPSLKPILLAAHLDVVPVEPGTESKWTHPPFDGTVADGFVWGRGTLDMKVSALGIMEGAEFLLKNGFAPKRTIYFAFGHDEEVGGPNGASAIAAELANRGVRLEFTLDEGLVITHGIVPGVKQPAALIGVAEKGKVTLELIANLGREDCGHSSRPPIHTAIGKLGGALYRLESNQMPMALKPPVSDMFDELAPAMPFVSRFVIANRWLLEPLLLSRLEKGKATNASIRNTTAVTIIRGGIKANQIPCSSKAIVDFRIIPGNSVEGVIDHVRKVINDPDIEIRITGSKPSEPSAVSDMNSTSFADLRITVKQIFPDTLVAPGMMIGRTDSRHYSSITDNSYRFLPIRLRREDLKRIHGTNERISIENYVEIIRFYVQFFRNTASGGGG